MSDVSETGAGTSVELLGLHVPDIECEHCVASIETILTSVPGVQYASADGLSRAVRLRYDARVTEQEIRRILAEAGYPTAP